MDTTSLTPEIRATLRTAVDALCAAGQLAPGSLIVLGCSTSEVAGGRIGKASVPQLGPVIARAMLDACAAHGVHAAFQCCEHLNRAIVMEKAVLRERGLTQVAAVPSPRRAAASRPPRGSCCMRLRWPWPCRRRPPST